MKTILFLSVLFFSNMLDAQHKNAVWCFGHYAFINFNGSVPVPDSSHAISRGSCASICDTSGNLNFYVAGDTVALYAATLRGGKIYNKLHQLMQGGDSIVTRAWYNEEVIIPFPNDTNMFYVFTAGVTSIYGLYYSVVDLSLNGGLGAVIQKNVMLKSFAVVDCLSAVKHGNGRDWWLIYRKSDVPTGGSNNRYYEYLITPNGIINYGYQNIGTPNSTNLANICFNKEGNMFVFTNYQGMIEKYDFDRCTGIISNAVNIYPQRVVSGSYINYLGSALSPNGKVLYVAYNNDSSLLLQYDLTAVNIASTEDTIWKQTYPINAAGFLRLAPDNKIYLSCAYVPLTAPMYPYADSLYNMYNMNLSVINSPDSLDTACNFQPYSFYLGGKRTYWGLPNNPNYDMPPLYGSACDTLRPVVNFAATDTGFCSNQCISFNDSSTKSPTKWQWFFTGAVPDTSTLENPANICYNSPGGYDVKLIACNEVGCDTLLLSNYINVYPSPLVELGNDTSTCNSPVQLDAGAGNATYQWSNGDSTQIITAVASATYTVTVTNGGGCSNTDSVIVSINPLPVVELGNDTSSCNVPVQLDAGAGNTAYQWSNGDTTQILTAVTSATYTVTVTDVNGCNNSDSVMVTINPLPAVSFNAFSTDTLCITHGVQTINLGHPPGGSYSGTGVTGNSFDPNVTGTGWQSIIYQYTDSLGCINTVTDSVWVDLCAGIASISNDDEIKIFPNPAYNSITIITKNKKNYALIIYDMIGQAVQTVVIGNNTNHTLTVDISHLAPGTYFLKFFSQQNLKAVQRFTKIIE